MFYSYFILNIGSWKSYSFESYQTSRDYLELLLRWLPLKRIAALISLIYTCIVLMFDTFWCFTHELLNKM
jgi:hypothetical protein